VYSTVIGNHTIPGYDTIFTFYYNYIFHSLKIRTKKQGTDVGKYSFTDVGKYSFVNRAIKSWNQLPAGLIAAIPCKLNTFIKRDKNEVRSRKNSTGD
jgi:hypothetical protein